MIFGAHFLAGDLASTEVIDRRFVEPRHGTQRSGNEMQLVLNDEVGRSRISRIAAPEEARSLTAPRHGGELVGGRDHECRQPLVDRFVDRDDRQMTPPREIAAPVDAAHLQVFRVIGVGIEPEGMLAELRAAPGTSIQRQRRVARGIGFKTQGLGTCRVVRRVALPAHIVGCRGAAHPERVLYAEDRGLMPDHPVYQQHYSLGGLFALGQKRR